VIELIRLDFPTFGLPTSANFTKLSSISSSRKLSPFDVKKSATNNFTSLIPLLCDTDTGKNHKVSQNPAKE